MVGLLLSFVFIAFGVHHGITLAQEQVFILTSPGEHLASSSSNGNVFVSAGGILYRLSSELQLIQNVTVFSSTVGLTATDDGDWLVACFNTSSCTVYNTSDLTITNVTMTAENTYPPGSSNIALFTAPTLGMQTFYIGSGETPGRVFRFTLLQRGFAGSVLSKDFTSNAAEYQSLIGRVQRQIYEGFHYNDSAYFLALDILTEQSLVSLVIIRVCNDGDDSFNAIYELHIGCGDGWSSASVITINGVSEVAGILVVSVGGRVCSYDLADINMIMDSYFSDCFGATFTSNLFNSPPFGSTLPCAAIANVSLYEEMTQKLCLNTDYPQQKADHPALCNFMASDPSLILSTYSSQPVTKSSLLFAAGVDTCLAIMVNKSSVLFLAYSSNSKHFIGMVSIVMIINT